MRSKTNHLHISSERLIHSPYAISILLVLPVRGTRVTRKPSNGQAHHNEFSVAQQQSIIGQNALVQGLTTYRRLRFCLFYYCDKKNNIFLHFFIELKIYHVCLSLLTHTLLQILLIVAIYRILGTFKSSKGLFTCATIKVGAHQNVKLKIQDRFF